MFGPVTDAERRGWQQRAVALLGRLLGEDLPVMAWTITPTGDLVARALGSDPGARRAAFDAWTDRFGAARWEERDGHLHAVAERFEGVHVAVTADILVGD